MKARFPLREAKVEVQGDSRQARFLQRDRLSAAVAADGRADHQHAAWWRASRPRRADRAQRMRQAAQRVWTSVEPRRATSAAPSQAPVDDEVAADPPRAAARAVLSGRFFGNRDAGRWPNASPTFSARRRGEALDRLVRPARGAAAALPIPRRCAPRSIATSPRIDALMASSSTPSSTIRACAGSRARWRGVAWLVGGVELSEPAQGQDAERRWPEICRDLERAVEFDQSQLFRKVYEEEFGTPGGEPYGLLVVDHEVRHRPSAGAPHRRRERAGRAVGRRRRGLLARHARRLAGPAAGRQLRRSRYVDRSRRPVAQRRPRALAQPLVARRHALRRRRAAARAGPPALAG